MVKVLTNCAEVNAVKLEIDHIGSIRQYVPAVSFWNKYSPGIDPIITDSNVRLIMRQLNLLLELSHLAKLSILLFSTPNTL